MTSPPSGNPTVHRTPPSPPRPRHIGGSGTAVPKEPPLEEGVSFPLRPEYCKSHAACPLELPSGWIDRTECRRVNATADVSAVAPVGATRRTGGMTPSFFLTGLPIDTTPHVAGAEAPLPELPDAPIRLSELSRSIRVVYLVLSSPETMDDRLFPLLLTSLRDERVIAVMGQPQPPWTLPFAPAMSQLLGFSSIPVPKGPNASAVWIEAASRALHAKFDAFLMKFPRRSGRPRHELVLLPPTRNAGTSLRNAWLNLPGLIEVVRRFPLTAATDGAGVESGSENGPNGGGPMDWYVTVDDDTYVIARNARHILAEYHVADHEGRRKVDTEALYVGHLLPFGWDTSSHQRNRRWVPNEPPRRKIVAVLGGGGVFMNAVAVKLVMWNISACIEEQSDGGGDLRLAACLDDGMGMALRFQQLQRKRQQAHKYNGSSAEIVGAENDTIIATPTVHSLKSLSAVSPDPAILLMGPHDVSPVPPIPLPLPLPFQATHRGEFFYEPPQRALGEGRWYSNVRFPASFHRLRRATTFFHLLRAELLQPHGEDAAEVVLWGHLRRVFDVTATLSATRSMNASSSPSETPPASPPPGFGPDNTTRIRSRVQGTYAAWRRSVDEDQRTAIAAATRGDVEATLFVPNPWRHHPKAADPDRYTLLAPLQRLEHLWRYLDGLLEEAHFYAAGALQWLKSPDPSEQNVKVDASRYRLLAKWLQLPRSAYGHWNYYPSSYPNASYALGVATPCRQPQHCLGLHLPYVRTCGLQSPQNLAIIWVRQNLA